MSSKALKNIEANINFKDKEKTDDNKGDLDLYDQNNDYLHELSLMTAPFGFWMWLKRIRDMILSLIPNFSLRLVIASIFV